MNRHSFAQPRYQYPPPAIILCGGKGTRIRAVSEDTPKPLIEIDGKPLVSYIIKHLIRNGFKKIILAVGYKGFEFKERFKKFFDKELFENSPDYYDYTTVSIDLIYTGEETDTATRIKKVLYNGTVDTDYPEFLVTYGDGVSDIDLRALYKYYAETQADGVITAVRSPERFGVMDMDEKNAIRAFIEKPVTNYWINGGFMVLKKELFDSFAYDTQCSLEKELLPSAIKNGKHILAYKHDGFWQHMDTLHEYNLLVKYHKEGKF